MPIAFRASAEAHTVSGATTITIPGTVQAGDAMLLIGGLNDATVPDFDWQPPAGWTALHSSRAGSNLFGALYGRVATAGDPGSPVLLDSDSTGKSGVVLVAYSGTDPIAPFNAHAMAVESTSTTNHVTPTAAASVENAQIVIAAVQSNSATESWSTPSGYTKRQDSIDNGNINGHVTVTAQDKAVTSLGSYGGETLTAAAVSSKALMFTVVLAPASTTQTSRPTSDIAATGAVGVPTPGGGSGIYARLAANVDTEYAQLDDSGSVQVGMAPLGDPLTSSGHVVEFRACYAGGASSGDVVVTLKQGSTTIATRTVTLTNAFADGDFTLTSGEANAISDYAALRLTFAADLS